MHLKNILVWVKNKGLEAVFLSLPGSFHCPAKCIFIYSALSREEEGGPREGQAQISLGTLAFLYYSLLNLQTLNLHEAW